MDHIECYAKKEFENFLHVRESKPRLCHAVSTAADIPLLVRQGYLDASLTLDANVAGVFVGALRLE